MMSSAGGASSESIWLLSTRLVGGPSASGRSDFSAGRRVGSMLTALRMSSLAAVMRAISSLS